MSKLPSHAFSRITGHVLWLIAALAVMVPSSSRAQDSAEIDIWSRRYVHNEPAALAAASAVAQRSGHVLRLKLRDRTLELENATDYCSGDGERCDDGSLRCDGVNECRSYWFMRHEKNANAFILRVVSYDEDRTVLWLDDRTGKVTEINSEPHFSPDRTHFAIVQSSDCCGYSGIQVWRTEGPALIAEYHELNFDPLLNEPLYPRIYVNFIRWLDNDSFLLSTHWNNETSGTTLMKRHGGLWALERPPEIYAVRMDCAWGRRNPVNRTGALLPLKLPDGQVCYEDRLNVHVETEVRHCAFSAAASPCTNIEIPRVR